MRPGSNEDASPARRLLRSGWRMCATAPGECGDPQALEATARDWLDAIVPGTVAESLREAGRWSLDGPPRRFDAEDWWYRLHFDAGDAGRAGATLEFEGLATLCEVWLNGLPLPASENMFARHVVAADNLRGHNELYLVFRSLDAALETRRPRPRWRAPMVENPQLRWLRTTLLGRTPGWSPPAAAVGPWRPVVLCTAPPAVEVLALHAGLEGGTGVLRFEARLHRGDGHVPVLELRRNGTTLASCPVELDGDTARCTLCVAPVERWFPHTHGEPVLYEALLDGASLGKVGFRRIEHRPSIAGGFALCVNDIEVFCRGACWTPLDIVSLRAEPQALRQALQQAVSAGFNMLRISGPFIYEDEAFFALCDEMGLMVWQEFMFANMDYPETDQTFTQSVRREATQQLRMWARHPCVAVICGNSEVSQQAAMWGTSRDLWSPPLFDRMLGELAAAYCPDVAWWPSSASGGDLPHQPDTGTTSYYGIGAYLRGFDDLRRSGVAFATECLGFANVPEDAALQALPGGALLRVHHPEWKRRVPRDLGAGWDFDDVRDHYLQQLFGVDPLQLRYADHERYLQLSRRVPGEAMAAAFVEWRRATSCCRGALVWFLRDLWAGAGWGLVDASGEPKAAWHVLRALLQPRWLGITDEGLNGLAIHMGNETARPMAARLEVALYRDGRHLITRAARDLELAPRCSTSLNAASLLNEFHDLTHAYRFGPLACDLVVATLVEVNSGAPPLQAFHLPRTHLHATPAAGLELRARARRVAGDACQLEVTSNGFARSVHIDAPGYVADTQYFHLAPGATLTVDLQPRSAGPPALRGWVRALNSHAVPIEVER